MPFDFEVNAGATDQSIWLRALATDGTPATTIAYNSAGIDLWYQRTRGTKVSITEATLAAVDSIHADGGFIHVGDGIARLDLPDAAVAAGAPAVVVGGSATGVVFVPAVVRILPADPLRKNTALSEFVFNMYDGATDPPTLKDDIDAANVVVRRRIDGGSLTTGTISGITNLGGGQYSCDFAAADRNGTTVYVEFSSTDPNVLVHGFTWTLKD
jgi:hypothetical protein